MSEWKSCIYTEQHPPKPADMVVVVRCKDCKFYKVYTIFGRSFGWCYQRCDEFDASLARETDANDFCSRGERKEE